MDLVWVFLRKKKKKKRELGKNSWVAKSILDIAVSSHAGWL